MRVLLAPLLSRVRPVKQNIYIYIYKIILETKMDDIFKELVGLAQWHGGTLCGVCRPNILPLSLVGRGQASFFATLLRTLLHAFPL